MRWTKSTRGRRGRGPRRATVSPIRGCGMSASARPGISAASSNVPSRSAQSTAPASAGSRLSQRLPFVDVGDVQERPRGPAHAEADGVAELVPVWDADRRHPEPVAQGDLAIRLHLVDDHVAQRNQLAPGSVRAQETRHARRRVDRHSRGSERLAAEIHEARVVADVGMGEKDAVHERPAHGPFGVERFELGRQVGSGVDHETPARLLVHQAQAGDSLPPRGIAPRGDAAFLPAADVRKAAVLRDTEHDRSHARRRAGRRPGLFAAERTESAEHESQRHGKDVRPRHPWTASRIASATSLPRLPTSPAGPTQDGQPSRHGAGGDQRAALGAAAGRAGGRAARRGRCRPGSCRRGRCWARSRRPGAGSSRPRRPAPRRRPRSMRASPWPLSPSATPRSWRSHIRKSAAIWPRV